MNPVEIEFPAYCGQHYYAIHYRYVLEMLKKAPEAQITFKDILEDLSNVSFRCSIGNKQVIFAFSDSGTKFEDSLDAPIYYIRDMPIFKFHYNVSSKFSNNVFPFTPVSFHDWDEYYRLKPDIRYNAKGNVVLNNQRPYGGALQRRKEVREILRKVYKSNVDFAITDQKTFWMKSNDCLVSVHVPGYCNNLIDRGQIQMMAFGVCTISPNLPEMLPFDKCFEPGVHYIRCNDDYSDLTKKIEWVKENRDEAAGIGRNAKTFFEEFGTPEKLWKWIEQCLN